jgi:hypothetical protein
VREHDVVARAAKVIPERREAAELPAEARPAEDLHRPVELRAASTRRVQRDDLDGVPEAGELVGQPERVRLGAADRRSENQLTDVHRPAPGAAGSLRAPASSGGP